MSKTRTYPGYDPYEIMVAVAHEEGLRFEAWINPYRLSLGKETTASFEHTPFYAKYQSMILEYQGKWYMSGVESAKCGGTAVSRKSGGRDLRTLSSGWYSFDDYFFVDGMQDTLPQEEKCRR